MNTGIIGKTPSPLIENVFLHVMGKFKKKQEIPLRTQTSMETP